MTDDAVYLVPSGLLSGASARTAVESGMARWLAGGPSAFTACAVLRRTTDGRRTEMRSVTDLQSCRARGEAQLAAAVEAHLQEIASPRAPFAGLAMDRPRIMGVVNVTPDSFSDGGRYASRDAAIAHGRALRDAGADILDIGGESTRPGAATVSIQQELDRVLPVVEALAADGALVSIDTRHAAVMRAALAAGARIVNDITALAGDPDSLAAVAATNASVVLMHMQGEPRTMQQNPVYLDAPLDVFDVLAERVGACAAAGIDRSRIAVDPGIGFGKRDPHNLALIADLALFHALGCAILLGVSRKSFIGRLSRGEDADHRLPGSLAAGLAGIARGAQILRVHDAADTAQALAIWTALART